MRQQTLLALSMCVLGMNSALAEGFTEHKQHQHGQAQLNIAIEKNEIEVEFLSPAMNLLGFEYKPSSTEDKRQFVKTLTTLRKGEELFLLKSCQLKESDIHSTLIETAHVDDHSGHKRDVSEHDHDSAHKDNHSDFSVHYHFHCPDGVPDRVQTDLFMQFSGLESVAVTVLGEKQIRSTLNRKKNVINLL